MSTSSSDATIVIKSDSEMHCIDKQGKPFEVKKYSLGDYASLEAMYVSFYPKGKFQGMPPLTIDASRKWIDGLLKNGENFLAWQDDKTVGHVAVLPDFDKHDGEYLIFVSHLYRGHGIGSELTRLMLRHVKTLGIKLIWLVVGTTNIPAIGLYKKFGFSFCQHDITESERQMILRL